MRERGEGRGREEVNLERRDCNARSTLDVYVNPVFRRPTVSNFQKKQQAHTYEPLASRKVHVELGPKLIRECGT